MNESLIKEYVKIVLQEGGYFRYNDKKKKSGGGFLDTIKDFFMGHGPADKIAESWIEDQELYYDFGVPDDIQKQVLNFVKAKLNRVSQRTRGDKDKTSRIIRKALDKKFSSQLRALEKQHYNIEDDEEEI